MKKILWIFLGFFIGLIVGILVDHVIWGIIVTPLEKSWEAGNEEFRKEKQIVIETIPRLEIIMKEDKAFRQLRRLLAESGAGLITYDNETGQFSYYWPKKEGK